MNRLITKLRVSMTFICVCAYGVTLGGCEMLARTQGKFPIVGSFGEKAIGDSGLPLSEDLYIPNFCKHGSIDHGNLVPLVRVVYREPFATDFRVVNGPGEECKYAYREGYYMVIDVTNVVRNPRLGAEGDDRKFKLRLTMIAEMLIVAADWNGEAYWRHLTTFLETYKAVNTASKAALGAAIAASFINPIVGASLAGAALVTETFVGGYTSSLNIDEYAAMRDAASTYRKVLKQKLFLDIETAKPGADAVNGVLQQAYDYAFTFSVKGAIHAATQQNKELRNLLITGQSEWTQYFQAEILRNRKWQRDSGSITDVKEIARINALIKDNEERMQLDAASQASVGRDRWLVAIDSLNGRVVGLRSKLADLKSRQAPPHDGGKENGPNTAMNDQIVQLKANIAKLKADAQLVKAGTLAMYASAIVEVEHLYVRSASLNVGAERLGSEAEVERAKSSSQAELENSKENNDARNILAEAERLTATAGGSDAIAKIAPEYVMGEAQTLEAMADKLIAAAERVTGDFARGQASAIARAAKLKAQSVKLIAQAHKLSADAVGIKSRAESAKTDAVTGAEAVIGEVGKLETGVKELKDARIK